MIEGRLAFWTFCFRFNHGIVFGGILFFGLGAAFIVGSLGHFH
jgi:hypothetical protein